MECSCHSLGIQQTPPRENPRRRGSFVAGPSSVVGARKSRRGGSRRSVPPFRAQATIQTEQMQVAVFPILGGNHKGHFPDSISLVDLPHIASRDPSGPHARGGGGPRRDHRGGHEGVSRHPLQAMDAKLPRVPPG